MSIDHTHGGLDLLATLNESGLEVGVTGCPGCRAERLARRDALPVPEPPTPAFPAPSDDRPHWTHDAVEWEWDDRDQTWDRVTWATFGAISVTQSESFDGQRITYGALEVEFASTEGSRMDDAEAIADVFDRLRADLSCAELAARRALEVTA